MIDFGIITAPRAVPTLDYSINSLRETGYKGLIRIFAEPASYNISGKNIQVNIHNKKKGCFKNFDFALRSLIESSKTGYICVSSDDVVYCKYLLSKLKDIKNSKEDFGCYDLYTSMNEENICHGDFESGCWNEFTSGWQTHSSISIMKVKTAIKLIQHPFYINHLNNYEKNEQIDSCVAETFKQMGLPCYVHSPSLTYTIGKVSTLNHNNPTDGFNYVHNLNFEKQK